MTTEDAATPQGRGAYVATLQHLFDSVDDPIDNAHQTCTRVIPYVLKALKDAPSSRQLQETLTFLQCGAAQPTHAAAAGAAETEAGAPWTCSNGELHAIVHMLNDEQLLIEDRGTTTATTATPVNNVGTTAVAMPASPTATASEALSEVSTTAAELDAAFLEELSNAEDNGDQRLETNIEDDNEFLNQLQSACSVGGV